MIIRTNTDSVIHRYTQRKRKKYDYKEYNNVYIKYIFVIFKLLIVTKHEILRIINDICKILILSNIAHQLYTLPR